MQTLYQSLPSIDKLLKTAQGAQLAAEFGHSATVKIARQLLENARQDIKLFQKDRKSVV